MAGFESTMLHKVAPQPFASQLPRESEALCRFRVDYRYWWPSPVSRGESHEDSLQAGPPTIDRGGEQVRNKRERKSWPICAPIVDRVPPRKFSRESFQGGKEKIPVFFNRFEIRYVLLVGRALWDAADSRVNRIPWRRGWKTNRKGRALMECHGLGIWILIRASRVIEQRVILRERVNSSFTFLLLFFFITWIRDINDEWYEGCRNWNSRRMES